MNTRREIPELVSRVVIKRALMVVVALGAVSAHGQNITTLLQFTNVWKYDRSGLELGAAWRTNNYDDSTWASGPGLLGYETITTPYLAQVSSGFGTVFPAPLSQTVTTYYFRTTFEFNNSPQNVVLLASNLVDDGCLVWLNGRLAGNFRIPPAGQFGNAAIFATGGPASEGLLEPMFLTNFLRRGVNQLAVEVHQSSNLSEDVVLGVKLMALSPTPLTITNEPQDLTIIAGDTATLSIGVSGGPVIYRWQKDGINIAGQTNSTIAFSNAQPALTGNYRVICSNAITLVTSDVARVSVLPDFIGPSVISASDDGTFGPDRIFVLFSEIMDNQSARQKGNYQLIRLSSGANVSITNVLATSSRALLVIDASDSNWSPDEDYLLALNNVKDRNGNTIAPGTKIKVIRPTPLLTAATVWSSHSRYFLDPTIYDQPWAGIDFNENPQHWVSGVGPFCGGFVATPPCNADCETPIDYQLSPTLFRSIFQWPVENGSKADLILNGSVDDGLLVFLNGVEIWRTNVAGISPRTTVTNTAPVGRSEALCFATVKIAVTNLLAGSNCLAAAIVQAGGVGETDTAFFLTVDTLLSRGPIPPSGPPPELNITRLDPQKSRISWIGDGYLLEGTTNLTLDSRSYPLGPWIQVTNMANPYTNSAPAGSIFFRLKQP